MVDNETQAVSRLAMLSDVERQKVLVEWNATAAEYPSESCVHELFEAQVERTPQAVAVVYGEEAVSYRELNERANRLAHYLRDQGVKPESRVAICVERSVEMVVAVLATLKAGGAYVPMDPTYPRERLVHMLQDSAPEVALTRGAGTEAVRGLSEDAGCGFREGRCAVGRSGPEKSGLSEEGLGARSLAYVIYTSGSTGLPKGVMIEHRGLSNYLEWAKKTYLPEKAVVSSTLSFDATITSLYVPLMVGGKVELLPESEEVEGLYEDVRQGAGLVKITPSHLRCWVSELPTRG